MVELEQLDRVMTSSFARLISCQCKLAFYSCGPEERQLMASPLIARPLSDGFAWVVGAASCSHFGDQVLMT